VTPAFPSAGSAVAVQAVAVARELVQAAAVERAWEQAAAAERAWEQAAAAERAPRRVEAVSYRGGLSPAVARSMTS
jgi:hypothetical protein